MDVEEYKKISKDLEKASGITHDFFRKNHDYLVSTSKCLRENGVEMQERFDKLIKEKEQKYTERQKLKRKIDELEQELQANKLKLMEMDPDRKRTRHETEQVKKRNN